MRLTRRPAPRRYRRAVAAGVEELLGEYRGALLRLEQELLTGANTKAACVFAFCFWGPNTPHSKTCMR